MKYSINIRPIYKWLIMWSYKKIGLSHEMPPPLPPVISLLAVPRRTSVLSPLSCSFVIFPGSFYCCCVWVYLSYTYSSIDTTCPSIPAVRFASRLCFTCLFVLIVVVLSGEPRQKQGRGLVGHKEVRAPSNFYCWPSQGGSSVLVLW